MIKENIKKIILSNRPEFAAAQIFSETQKEKQSLESFANWCLSSKYDSRNLGIWAADALKRSK